LILFTRSAIAVLLVAVVALVIAYLSFQLPAFWQFEAGIFATLVLAALGVNMWLGNAGLLSLASPTIMGLAAYSFTFGLTQLHLPLLVALAVALAAATAGGLLLGLFAARISGFEFAIITLGLLLVFQALMLAGGNLTGGAYGLVLPQIILPGELAIATGHVTAIAIFLSCIGIIVAHNLGYSRSGRAATALKTEVVAVELSGVNIGILRAKILAFGAFVLGTAGILSAMAIGVVEPGGLGSSTALFQLSIVVVAGMNRRVLSVVLSAAVLFVIPLVFKGLHQYSDLFYGTILLGSLIVRSKVRFGWRDLGRASSHLRDSFLARRVEARL
jgi:branched-chain amino acid transport system permease protein